MSLDEYFEEITLSIQQIRALKKREIVLLGHSTGALIATYYVNNNSAQEKIDGLILNAPFYIRQTFFMGYYAGDGSKKDPALSITNKGAIGSAGLFYRWLCLVLL